MKFAHLMTCVAALGFATAAQAQHSTADTIDREGGYSDGARAIKKTAACVFERNPGYVDSMLAARPDSPEEGLVFTRVLKVMENCMSTLTPAMSVNSTQARGSMAEARYLTAHPKAPNFATMNHLQAKIPASWTATKLSEADMIEVLKRDFANCVVADQPMLADALLRTVPTSLAEKAAARKLVPSLGPCLQNGLKFQLDYPILRALVAEALDRSVTQWEQGTAAAGGTE
jgi:hypothetical protein